MQLFVGYVAVIVKFWVVFRFSRYRPVYFVFAFPAFRGSPLFFVGLPLFTALRGVGGVVYPSNVHPVAPVLVYAFYDVMSFLFFFRLVFIELTRHKLAEKARIC